jgi:hypothetical protein
MPLPCFLYLLSGLSVNEMLGGRVMAERRVRITGPIKAINRRDLHIDESASTGNAIGSRMLHTDDQD